MKSPANFIYTTSLLFLLFSKSFSQASFNTAKMDSLLDAYDQKNKLMLSLSISQDGNLVYSRAIGYAEVETNTKANLTTKYRIGSITKMFTSVMIQQLIEEKKLKLSTTLSKFFPKIRNAKKITIEQLLQHRTGLHNYTDDLGFFTDNVNPKTEKEMLELFYSQPNDFEPGEKYKYANTNYVLLGYIIEKLTKKSYPEALQERILNKIGLKNTYYGGKTDVSKNEARSYVYLNKTWTLGPEWDMSLIHGAGAIVSTTEDLVKFIEALFSYQLISDKSVKQMCTLKDNYGFGMVSIPFYSKFALGHNGHWDVFESMVGYFPLENMSIAFSANGKNANTNDFIIAVLSIYFNLPYEIPKFNTHEVPESILDEYVGAYHSDLLQMDFIIAKDGLSLTCQTQDQLAFILEAVDDFNFKYEAAGLVIEFKRNDQNIVDQLILKQAGMEFVFSKHK